MNVAARPRPASPCIGACAIDPANGLCAGCARTGDEIALWGSADAAIRASIWVELPARAAALGLPLRRLAWREGDLLDHMERLFRDAAGAFVVGIHGAVAEVMRVPDEDFQALRDGLVLTLRTRRAAIRLEAPAHLTAFELFRAGAAPVLALAVPAGRLGPDGPSALTALGPDTGALLPRDAGGARFDLGLGRRAARVSIRCAQALAARLAPHCGAPWPGHLDLIAADVLAESPVRVVETPCIRAEVDAVIPPPGGRSPDGPHTHLLPELVRMGLDAPPSLARPKGYVLSALFYPA
jgi:predicted Fe-S protein YdhL (DUF1289 family)